MEALWEMTSHMRAVYPSLFVGLSKAVLVCVYMNMDVNATMSCVIKLQ